MTLQEAYKIMEQGAVGYTLERYNEACGVVYKCITQQEKKDENIKLLIMYLDNFKGSKNLLIREVKRYLEEIEEE